MRIAGNQSVLKPGRAPRKELMNRIAGKTRNSEEESVRHRTGLIRGREVHARGRSGRQSSGPMNATSRRNTQGRGTASGPVHYYGAQGSLLLDVNREVAGRSSEAAAVSRDLAATCGAWLGGTTALAPGQSSARRRLPIPEPSILDALALTFIESR